MSQCLGCGAGKALTLVALLSFLRAQFSSNVILRRSSMSTWNAYGSVSAIQPKRVAIYRAHFQTIV